MIKKIWAYLRWLWRQQPDRVTIDRDAIHGWSYGIEVWQAPWDELQRVQVQTTDEGPYRDNCFMLLETERGEFQVPSETPGYPNLVTGITKELDGVDEEALVKSSAFDQDRLFDIWPRRNDSREQLTDAGD